MRTLASTAATCVPRSTYQQIVQVSGRAGRGEKPGRVFIQTRLPDATVMRALLSGDGEAFYAAETASRKAAKRPALRPLRRDHHFRHGRASRAGDGKAHRHGGAA